MKTKLKDVPVGQRFQMNRSEYIRLDIVNCIGLNHDLSNNPDVRFLYDFSTNSILYTGVGYMTYLNDMDVEVEHLSIPHAEGYDDFFIYNGKNRNPYNIDVQQNEWISWEKGFEKAFKDCADLCYDRVSSV